MGFPRASHVYRPLPGIPEGLDSPLASLLTRWPQLWNAGLAGRPGMQLSWWVGLHPGNGGQSRARPVAKATQWAPPSGGSAQRALPSTVLSWDLRLAQLWQRVAQREKGSGSPRMLGAALSAVLQIQGVFRDWEEGTPFSGACGTCSTRASLLGMAWAPSHSQGQRAQESEPRECRKCLGRRGGGMETTGVCRRHLLLFLPVTGHGLCPHVRCNVDTGESWYGGPWGSGGLGAHSPVLLLQTDPASQPAGAAAEPQEQVWTYLQVEQGITSALIPYGSMRASRGAQAGLRPWMVQDVHPVAKPWCCWQFSCC